MKLSFNYRLILISSILLRKDCDDLKFLKTELLNLFDIFASGTNGEKRLKIILNIQKNNQRKKIMK